VIRGWTGEELQRHKPRVLDSDLLVRDHVYGQSYQAFLLLDAGDLETAANSAQLTRRLAREERRFLLKCGGTVGWWGVVAAMIFWLDRLSRGYMTGRLVGIGAVLGVAVPIALVML
jgi:hypothetical protein